MNSTTATKFHHSHSETSSAPPFSMASSTTTNERFYETETNSSWTSTSSEEKLGIALAILAETDPVISGEDLTNSSFPSLFNETTSGNISGSGIEEVKSIGWTDITLVSIFCCIIAGTLVGNTLVIAAVSTTRRLRTVTNCFVMSLAVADWLVGIFVMPPKVMLHFENNVWPFGKIGCELWISLDILLCTASILSLCAISIDRYLAITRPLAYSRKRRSKRLALSMISCVWVAAAVITSPPILGWYDSTRNEDDTTTCEYNKNQGYVIYSALGSFFLPLLVMLYVYARIACVIARRQKTIQKLHNSSTNDKKYFDSEEAVGGDDVVHHFSAGSTLNKHSSLNLSSSSLSFWGCMKLKKCPCTKANKHGENKSKRGSNISDAIEPLQAQVPNPNTILSMSESNNSRNIFGSSKHGRSTSKNANKNGNGASATAAAALGLKSMGTSSTLDDNGTSTTNLTRLRTGSRLCHHSLANLSPQKSIARRVQTSSSSRVAAAASSTYSDNDSLPSTRHSRTGRKEANSASKIWTIEDEPDIDGIAKQVNSALLGSSGGELNEYGNHDDENELMYGSLNKYLKGKNKSESSPYNTNHNNLNSSAGYGQANSKSTNSIPLATASSGITSGHNQPQQHQQKNSQSLLPVRSKSVKLSLNFHVNDQNQNNSNSKEFTSGRIASFKRETKTAQTLAAVVGGFIFCWLPFFVVYVLAPFVEEGTFPDALMDFFVWLGWGNSAINPFIYAFYSADFRSAFWRLTFRKCEGIVRAARSPDRNSPKRYDDPQAHCHLRTNNIT